MRCEHEATLAKPTKDMLMGSTGVVRPVLPKRMVANLRHQSIINMNETKDSVITWQDLTTQWNSNFSRLFLKLMGYELKNTNYQMHKLLTRRRGALGTMRGCQAGRPRPIGLEDLLLLSLWSFCEMLLAPFLPCIRVIHEIPLPEPFTTTPLLAWLIFHRHYFALSPSPFFIFASCASTNFLQNKALASSMLVLYMCPRCQKMEASHDASWGTIS
jgi:hypothetical protein